MMIEDEPSAMNRYSTYITSYNPAFTIVAQASTYAQAKELFQRTKPDIIFSDIVIPGKSGLAFIEDIRSLGWDGLVVIISGYDDFSYAKQAIELSVFDYLLKPVFQKDFEQVLDKILAVMKKQHIFLGKGGNDPTLPTYIQRAIQYIEMNYNRSITLVMASEYANVSPSYLSAMFSRKCGTTFIEYLQTYRSEIASKYLRETNLTQEEIAEQVGFGDSSYLNRCFKKHFKMSPGKYRKSRKPYEDVP